ncbi:recombinase family protein [Planctomycetota bacterium]
MCLYVYGRTQMIRRADGSYRRIVIPREQWKVLIKDAHEGYISWEEYEKNQKQLQSWCRSQGGLNKRPGPPREG